MKNNTLLNTEDAVHIMNNLGAAGRPFLFIVNYTMNAVVVEPLPLKRKDILFNINGFTNGGGPTQLPNTVQFLSDPVPFSVYKSAFTKVMDEIKKGNSYLVNLTQPSFLQTNLTLEDIFYHSNAAYKLYSEDSFVVFSPETFITIKDGIIASHPMKGTIDATTPNARERILHDVKEKAEHMTIVDLIRNDLSIIAHNVYVKRLRYLQHITTNNRNLWQVSSEITGQLPDHYPDMIGHILFSLLPAGSVTGAPKPQTLRIIREAEKYDRGYYTGVFGYFDGQNLDSGVMIRFIEKRGDRLLYKSGGGITCQSNMETEYQELKNKIYVPFN